MKSYCNVLLRKLPGFMFLLFSFGGKAQITMSTANCTISSNELQMDIVLTNTGKNDLHWNSAVLRMTVPAGMVPAGSQTYVVNYIGGSDFPSSWPVAPAKAFGTNYNASQRTLTWTSGNKIGRASCRERVYSSV